MLNAAAKELGADQAAALLARLRDFAEDECVICFETESNTVTRCGHVYHRVCIEKFLKAQEQGGNPTSCPLCRQPVLKSQLMEAVDPSDDSAATNGKDLPLDAGAKVKAILQYLGTSMAPNEKLVVFSSFTKFLDLARSELEKAGVSTLRLDGRMTRGAREAAMKSLETDVDSRVMLCSLKAAGVGVTLTSANHLILADPWWNPAAEVSACVFVCVRVRVFVRVRVCGM